MMLCQTDRLPFKSHLRTLIVLFCHLLLIHFCSGRSQPIGSSQPIVATLGDDIILPCHLQPAVDATGLTLEWTRPDLNPRFVYVWRDGVELVGKKHKFFEGRTSLFINELKHGNISLKLSKVKLSDEGTYRCFIPGMEKQSFVQLVIASDAVSSSVSILAGVDRERKKVLLQCESKGWYPEPEVLWRDGEGNLLSAGPTETVRGSDDLYTVSSRVTVEKRHNNNFTCRVQQNNTKQTREAHIYIPEDFFLSNSSVPVITGLAVSLAVCIVFIFASGSFVWRQNIIKKKRSNMDKTERQLNENDTEIQVLPAKGTEAEQLMATPILSDNKKGKMVKKNKKFSKQRLKQQLQEEQHKREEAENRVKTMKQELETMKKKVENKQQLQQLHEEHQRKERDLQTLKEKLETKNKEFVTIRNSQSRFSWVSNNGEQQRIEEAQNEVQKLKKELETKEMELKKIEEKKAEVQQLCDDNQRGDTNLQRLTGELETNSTKLNDTEIKLTETFDELRKTREQLKSTSAELRSLEKELEKSKLKVLGLENSQKQSQEDVYPSVASHGTVRGRVYIEELDLDGKNVHLKNISHEDQPLGCWELQIQVDNKQPIIYTFLPSFTLKAGETVTIWPSSSGAEHCPPTNLVLWKSWGSADELLVTLLCCSGEVMAQTKAKNTKDVNCVH